MIETTKGRDLKVGQTFQSAHCWYKIISINGEVGDFSISLNVADMRGQMHPLLVGRTDHYPSGSRAGHEQGSTAR